ncbi:MAG: RluA family pseudouridine synthase [Pirellulaceae bacterium]
MQPAKQEDIEFETSHDDLGKRLDTVLASRVNGISRSRIQLLIRNELVTLDGETAKPSTQVRIGQHVVARLSELERLRPEEPQSEKMDLDILFEDDWMIALNKPAGTVVHPAKGHWSGTLTAGLMYHFRNLSSVGGDHRPGIVHRLDRDTSGVMVVAKHDAAHLALMKQFERRTVTKEYLAVVSPSPDRDRDNIEARIGVHPWQREKMAIRDRHPASKDARTFYEVQQRFGRFGLLKAFPKTGRTHQIRVHLAHIGCPILADRLYSGHSFVTQGWLERGVDAGEKLIERQALHAHAIKLKHPGTKQEMEFTAPLPEDFRRLLDALQSL